MDHRLGECGIYFQHCAYSPLQLPAVWILARSRLWSRTLPWSLPNLLVLYNGPLPPFLNQLLLFFYNFLFIPFICSFLFSVFLHLCSCLTGAILLCNRLN